MAKYRYYANAPCFAGDAVLKKFGQEYELSDQTALDILEGGGGIAPSDEFPFGPLFIRDKRERTMNNADYTAQHRQALAASFSCRDRLRKLKQERG